MKITAKRYGRYMEQDPTPEFDLFGIDALEIETPFGKITITSCYSKNTITVDLPANSVNKQLIVRHHSEILSEAITEYPHKGE